ncbi:MAG: isopenicillin-N epimerase [Phycisphaerales bacterium]|jgi:isopenicillin-N epimerase
MTSLATEHPSLIGLEPLVDPARLAEPVRYETGDGLVRLNHASYGLCPALVGEAQNELRRRVERDSVRYFKVDHERYCDAARDAIGSLVNCPPEDLVLVNNGTVAMAACIRAVPLSRGDEVLLTDHEYMATFNEVDRACRLSGATRTVAPVPFPGATLDGIFESVLSRVNERTKLVIVSHLASASGLIFPAERIVAAINERFPQVATLVDGAHGPGHVPIDLNTMAPTFYAASGHKWLGTPKGTGFVYANPEWQSRMEPMALSCRVHVKRPGRKAFLCDFDYVGTADHTANLVIPVSIAHLAAQHADGWAWVQKQNHELVLAGARLVCDALGKHGVDFPIPDEHVESLVGGMIAIPMPVPAGGVKPGEFFDDSLWDRLWSRGIQAPVWDLPGVHPRVMRLSAHLSNTIEDFEKLADVLADELGKED